MPLQIKTTIEIWLYIVPFSLMLIQQFYCFMIISSVEKVCYDIFV